MYYIPQIGQYDCGFACLKMMLAHVHHDKNYLYLPFRERNQPFSYQQLSNIASQHHLELIGFKVESENEILNNREFPLLVSLNYEGNNKHAALVSEIKGKTAKIIDPEKGIYHMRLNKFFTLWDKSGLLIKSFERTPCSFIYQNQLKRKDYVLPFICQIMTAVCGILAVYFITSNVPPFIPIILLVAFIFFEILLRSNLFQTMRKVDDEVVESAVVKSKEYSAFHQRLEKYKLTAIATPLKFLYAFLVSAFLIFVVIINDPRNIFLIFAPAILAFADAFYVLPNLKKREESILINERVLVLSKDIESFRQREKTIHEKAYRFGRLTLIKKYSFIFLMLLATCGVMIINQFFSIPYVVFYLCIEFALYTELKSLFSFPEEKKEYLRAQVSLVNIVHQNDEII
ncbi:MAG TPA: cysteine peptidase family C39 domain-containing protein [Bacilli bacterium]|nr:cysteine peptidase family C39 domain-containing protein [Bacilli bacterium]HPS19022.1 cysteine peptidase family C39 domain-containing protein [Bacilli bacterium]